MADVVVDDKAIADLGAKIIALKDLLDPAITDVGAVAIQAGTFADAENLTTVVDERKDGAIEFLNAMGERLVTDGEKLKETAKAYAETEKDNEILAKDVIPK